MNHPHLPLGVTLQADIVLKTRSYGVKNWTYQPQECLYFIRLNVYFYACIFKACVRFFYQMFIFQQMIALQKL